jgi:hypothetical protein
MSAHEYEAFYNTGSKKVVKIYENVKKPRSLAAYNVRFSNKEISWDKNEVQRF